MDHKLLHIHFTVVCESFRLSRVLRTGFLVTWERAHAHFVGGMDYTGLLADVTVHQEVLEQVQPDTKMVPDTYPVSSVPRSRVPFP